MKPVAVALSRSLTPSKLCSSLPALEVCHFGLAAEELSAVAVVEGAPDPFEDGILPLTPMRLTTSLLKTTEPDPVVFGKLNKLLPLPAIVAFPKIEVALLVELLLAAWDDGP